MKWRAILLVLTASQLHLWSSINAKPFTPGEHSYLNDFGEAKVFKRSTAAKLDYVETNRPAAMGRGLAFNKNLGVTVEVVLVLDYAISAMLKLNNDKIRDYASIMVDYLNTHYATIEEFKVRFQLAGFHAIQSKSAQPFIENSPMSIGKEGINHTKILNNFAEWVFQNSKTLLPPHDVVILLTNVSTSASGVAFLKGACWPEHHDAKKDTQSVGLINDDGHFYGHFVLAHEMAHSLGARHDGDDGNQCPNDGGYMMGSGRKEGVNKRHFSSCSKQDMKQFFESHASSCLDSIGGKPEIRQMETLNMNQFCIDKGGNFPLQHDLGERTDEPCEQLMCKLIDREHELYLYLTYGVPKDGSFPCGNNGVCQNKKCVESSASPMKNSASVAEVKIEPASNKPMNLDDLCEEKTPRQTGFKFHRDNPVSEQCKILKCIKMLGDGEGDYRIATLNSVPQVPDNAYPCGESGKCMQGKCISCGPECSGAGRKSSGSPSARSNSKY